MSENQHENTSNVVTLESLDERFEKLDHKINTLTSLVKAMIPKRMMPRMVDQLTAFADTPEEWAEKRRKEMIRVFEADGKYLTQEKKAKRNFPLNLQIDAMEVVPRAVLLNRAAQSRVFAPIDGSGEINNLGNAKATLKSLINDGTLILKPLNESGIRQTGYRITTTPVVMSPAAWEKYSKKKAEREREAKLKKAVVENWEEPREIERYVVPEERQIERYEPKTESAQEEDTTGKMYSNGQWIPIPDNFAEEGGYCVECGFDEPDHDSMCPLRHVEK